MAKTVAAVHKDWIRRGEPEYDEVCRILGNCCRWVADERVRQINNRWLKADVFLKDGDGNHLVINNEYIPTKSRRIRIPIGSTLYGRTFK